MKYENLKGRDHFEDIHIDWKIISKLVYITRV
jgi:hypothetical protein